MSEGPVLAVLKGTASFQSVSAVAKRWCPSSCVRLPDGQVEEGKAAQTFEGLTLES